MQKAGSVFAPDQRTHAFYVIQNRLCREDSQIVARMDLFERACIVTTQAFFDQVIQSLSRPGRLEAKKNNFPLPLLQRGERFASEKVNQSNT